MARPKLHWMGLVVFLSVVGAIGSVGFAARPAAAAVAYTVDPDVCITIVIDGTAPGSAWSLSASRPFIAAVANPVASIYYGPEVGTRHEGTTGSTYDNTFSACNACPGGPLTVNFGVTGRVVPPSTLGFPNPSYTSTSNVPNLDRYVAQCGNGGLGGFTELDEIPAMAAPVLGPILIVVAVVVLVVVALPVPAAGSAVASPTLLAGSPWRGDEPRSVGVPGVPPPPPTEGVHEIPPSPIQGGGMSIGGVGVTVGSPDARPPPTPPAHADPNVRPSCPRCGAWTVPAYGRWYCPRDAWYPWG